MLVGWGPKPSRPSDGSWIPGLALVSTTTCSSETGVEAMDGDAWCEWGQAIIMDSTSPPYSWECARSVYYTGTVCMYSYSEYSYTPISHSQWGECDGQR